MNSNDVIKWLKCALTVVALQASNSREGRAPQHGWRGLSDVTGDDSQSQSRVGGRSGAGGRELIRRPRVTRLYFLVSVSLHPAALFLSHRPPARLKPLLSLNTTAESLCLPHHWDYLLRMHLDGDWSKGTLCCSPLESPDVTGMKCLIKTLHQ